MKKNKARKALERIAIILLFLALAVAIISTLPDEQPDNYYCKDSDKGDVFLAGAVTDWRTGAMVLDRCANRNVLHEFSCQSDVSDPRGSVVLQPVECQYSCQAGRCVAPDLEITNVIITNTPMVNQEFRVSFEIENKGLYPASTIDVLAYFEPGYGVLVEAPQTIGPGESTYATYSATYKLPGTFGLVSIVDPHGIVAESDETNNQRSDDITIYSS